MNRNIGLLDKLPPPPTGKTGWPWTEETHPAIYEENAAYPKISIITPSFNQGIYIEETIRSVLLQNYPNLEYFVMDGGSKDNTVDIIKKYEPWLTYWVSEKDKGQSDSINKALPKTTGKIFNWINSDDYYTNGAFLHIAGAFMNAGAEVFSGKCNFFSGEENKIIEVDTGIELQGNTEDSILHHKMNQPSTFFDLDKVKSLGTINESLHYAMDWELLKRYLLCYTQSKVRETDKILSNFRIHDASKTSVSLELFEQDKNIVRYSILYSLGAPEYLLKAFREKNDIPDSQKPHKFQVNPAINRKKLRSVYFKGFPYYFYEKGAYKEARQCLHMIADYQLVPAITQYGELIVKLYFVPPFIMNFLRDLKKGKKA